MKYAAAVLLGLATVKAAGSNAAPKALNNVAKNVDAIFDGTAHTLFSQNGVSLVQTLDWDLDYGTYYTASQDAQYHYENYGLFAEAYVSADYLIDLTYYQFEITFTFFPFYVAPVDAWL